jgi:UDP-N-acetyl-D-glucosamine dehydrogenase
MNAQRILIQRIEDREAKVAIIGLGYVGLPLAVEFASAGLETVGIDLSGEKVDAINRGESYIADVPSNAVRELVEEGKLRATTETAALGEVDCICISVPTPLSKSKDPDISYIVAACDMIVQYFRPGVLLC